MIKVIISGGGTGGHVYPAIAIADALKKQVPAAEILFIGAKGKMEMEKVPAAGYPIEGLWVSGFQRRLTLKNLAFPFKVLHSMWKASMIIQRFKPVLVIGVGGYASPWWFVLTRMLGYENTKFYDGSAQEWTREPQNPLIMYRWE